jgi:glycosyl hydrolase family 123
MSAIIGAMLNGGFVVRYATHFFVGCILISGFGAADVTLNPKGIPWVDTIDHWGRPWGDAGCDFYRRLDAQRKHQAAHGVPAGEMQFAVGTETALRKVFRPKFWFTGDLSGAVTIRAAKGEYESFQLVVCPIADAERKVTYLSEDKEHGHTTFDERTVRIDAINVGPLEHTKSDYTIDPEHIQLYKVDYVETVRPQYPVMHVGEWPDPLLPMEPFDVANPNCQAIWVEVHVPRDAPAGEYQGTVTVQGSYAIPIEVALEVWDFALPEVPERISMGWALNSWFTGDGLDRELERLSVLLEHRLAPWQAAFAHHDNLDEFDRVMTFLLERGVRLQSTSGKPEPAFVEHLRHKGWLKHFITLWGDEPHDRAYPTYRERTHEIHEEYPGLTVAMTEEPTPDNVGLFDLWIAEPSAQRDEWVADALERGDRVWWYLCQLPIHALLPGPLHQCPGMVLDRPAIDHRMTYWFAFRQRIEGVSYWAVSAWPEGFENWPGEPWPVSPRVPFPYSGQHNGNGFLCYPGADGLPWPSIRLKIMRDGLEDEDYLHILRDRAGPTPSADVRALLDVPQELAGDLRYYNKDPQVLLNVRERLARAIVGLKVN